MIGPRPRSGPLGCREVGRLGQDRGSRCLVGGLARGAHRGRQLRVPVGGQVAVQAAD
jgi:hypothetical protein